MPEALYVLNGILIGLSSFLVCYNWRVARKLEAKDSALHLEFQETIRGLSEIHNTSQKSLATFDKKLADIKTEFEAHKLRGATMKARG